MGEAARSRRCTFKFSSIGNRPAPGTYLPLNAARPADLRSRCPAVTIRSAAVTSHGCPCPGTQFKPGLNNGFWFRTTPLVAPSSRNANSSPPRPRERWVVMRFRSSSTRPDSTARRVRWRSKQRRPHRRSFHRPGREHIVRAYFEAFLNHLNSDFAAVYRR